MQLQWRNGYIMGVQGMLIQFFLACQATWHNLPLRQSSGKKLFEKYSQCQKYKYLKRYTLRPLRIWKVQLKFLKPSHITTYYILNRYEVLQCGDVEKLIKKRKSPEDRPVYFATIEDTYDIITKAHIATGHGGRDRMLKHLGQKYANITTYAVELFKSYCLVCQEKRIRPMLIQAERMVKHARIDLKVSEAGDTVAVPIPMDDRGRGDPRNILGVILDRDENDMYRIAVKAGILTTKVSRNQFDLCPQRLLNDSDVNTEYTVTLRQALKFFTISDYTHV